MNSKALTIASYWNYLENKQYNKYVTVRWNKLNQIAEERAFDVFEAPNWRASGVYAKHEWAFASQEFFANCFNSDFNIFEKPDTKYTVENPQKPEKPFTGSYAMQRMIYEHCGERIPNADDFAEHVASPRAMKKFFGGTVPMPAPELKQICGECFVVNLKNQYGGNPLNLLEEAMVYDHERKRSVIRAFNGGKGLVELLVNNFGAAYGRDCYALNKNGIPLYNFLDFSKRAQLVAIMLHDRALDSGGILPLVADIDEVGPIADYELPKSFRALEVFEYSPELAELVDNWKEIKAESRMEIEIRAATVAACLRLLEEINDIRSDIPGPVKLQRLNICHIDYWLWKMGRDAKHLRPHLTRTSAY
ncbi:MAG: queuosine salvage family protein [bacterium]|nr:queuosine salvage family protein [bacterium]